MLDAPLEAVRRWLAAAALTRPGRATVLCGAPEAVALPAVEALVRWDPAWLAERELAERAELGLPPALRVAQLTGSRKALETRSPPARAAGTASGRAGARAGPPRRRQRCTRGTSAVLAEADAPARAVADHHVLVRVPLAATLELTRALTALKAVRSARKEVDVVAVRVDPLDMF